MKKILCFFTALFSFVLMTNFVSCSDDSANESPAEKITVTYDLNYDGAPAATVIQQEKNKSFTLQTFERTDYRLIGWADTSDATEIKYQSGARLTLSEDHTFYALWADADSVVTLTLNSNTASATETKYYVPKNTTYAIPANTAKCDGSVFIGWATSATATTATYSDGEAITLTADKTLYAVWVSKDNANLVTITYHSNDGTNKSYVQYILLGGSSSLSSVYHKLTPNEFTRDGYIMEGWAKTADATEAAYDDGDSVSNLLFITGSLSNPQLVKNVDFYAVWLDNTKLIITYTRNYSSSDTESFVKEISVTGNKATYTIEECPFEPETEGKVFACWQKDKYPGETIEFESETVRKITYKAVWISKTDSFSKKLTYYKDGSSEEKFEQYYNWSSQNELAIKDCPWTVEGAEFVGWAEYSSDKTPSYQPNERINTFGAPSSLYALWQ